MLGFIFGLNARLGRLHYFLATIVVAVVMTGLCFLLAFSILQTSPRGTQPSFEMVKGPVIGLGALFGVISFTLQSMRILATSDGTRSASSRPGSRSWWSTSRWRTNFPDCRSGRSITAPGSAVWSTW